MAHLESLINATIGGLGNPSLPGLGTLLQLVQASSASGPARERSANAAGPSIAPLPESAVEVAAAALGQLSQQTQSRGNLDINVINSVCALAIHYL